MNKCICESCKYFVPHYTFENGIIQESNCGHCSLNGRHYPKNPNHTICGLFKNIEYDNVQPENLISSIKNIEKQLEFIYLSILKKDA